MRSCPEENLPSVTHSHFTTVPFPSFTMDYYFTYCLFPSCTLEREVLVSKIKYLKIPCGSHPLVNLSEFNPSSQGPWCIAAKITCKCAEQGVINTIQALYFPVFRVQPVTGKRVEFIAKTFTSGPIPS